MISEVKVRLAGFGYTVKDSDRPYLVFAVEKAKNRVMNNINCDDIPDGLFYETVDLAAGLFLMDKKTFAPEDLSSLDLDVAFKSVKEGDTEVSYAIGEGSSTPEARLDALIGSLINVKESVFARYRKLVW